MTYHLRLDMPGGGADAGYEGPVPNELLMPELRPKLKALCAELRDHIQGADKQDDW
ncbi:hypothetical protein [Halomonas sp. I5-271120]|uniref:hypothetical protein n=1 Tax=Halomonas sp. I5-271120 TaxID=3061632 RepID=UPI002714D4D8|nr:hypothetical protein [Halomonas sp. I5-271120]